MATDFNKNCLTFFDNKYLFFYRQRWKLICIRMYIAFNLQENNFDIKDFKVIF